MENQVSAAIIGGVLTTAGGVADAFLGGGSSSGGSSAAAPAPGANANGGGGGNVFNGGSLFGTVTNRGTSEGGKGGTASYSANDPNAQPATDNTMTWILIGLIGVGLAVWAFLKRKK